jgi:hypothetical protein
VCFVPVALVVPVYHKIRVEYDLILHRVLQRDEEFRKWLAEESPSIAASVDLEWDVFIISATNFKKDLRDAGDLPAVEKQGHLERPFPRFLWRATCFICGTRAFDVLYDATDIAQSTSLEVDWVRYRAPEPS